MRRLDETAAAVIALRKKPVVESPPIDPAVTKIRNEKEWHAKRAAARCGLRCLSCEHSSIIIHPLGVQNPATGGNTVEGVESYLKSKGVGFSTVNTPDGYVTHVDHGISKTGHFVFKNPAV